MEPKNKTTKKAKTGSKPVTKGKKAIKKPVANTKKSPVKKPKIHTPDVELPLIPASLPRTASDLTGNLEDNAHGDELWEITSEGDVVDNVNIDAENISDQSEPMHDKTVTPDTFITKIVNKLIVSFKWLINRK